MPKCDAQMQMGGEGNGHSIPQSQCLCAQIGLLSCAFHVPYCSMLPSERTMPTWVWCKCNSQ